MSRPESSSSRIAIFGPQHGELERLVALLLATGEVDVEGTVQESLLEPDPLGLGAQHRLEVGGVAPARRQRLGEDVDERHARHLDRVLHHEVEACGGAAPGGHRQHVLAVERDRAGDRVVAGLAHHDRRERALAGAVRAHDGVHLAGRHGEVDPAQDLIATDRGAKAADLERAHCRTSVAGPGVDRDHDLAVDDRSLEHRHGLRGRQRDRLAVEETERAAVLRALELLLVAPHLALGERHVGVTAHVADRVHVVVDAHHGDRYPTDHEPAGRARCELVEGAHGLAHGGHACTSPMLSLAATRVRSSSASEPAGS